MESTTTLIYEDIDYSHFWNMSDNLTYYYHNMEDNEVLQFLNLTRIIMPTLTGLIVLFGMFGNILTVAAIVRRTADRGITKYLILNMAMIDLLYVVLFVSFEAAYIALHYWPFGGIWCWIHTFLGYVCYFAKMYTLVLISLDRYVITIHPVRAVILRTKRNCCIALLGLWGFIILESIVFISMAKELNVELEGTEEVPKICSIYFEDSTRYSIVFFMFSYLLPLIVLFGLSGHMLKVFLTTKSPEQYSIDDQNRFQSKKRVTKMAMMVVTCFAVCWLPLHIIMLNVHVPQTEHATVRFASLLYGAKCLAYLNSCINPILYLFYIHMFRNGIKNLVCCRKTMHLELHRNSSEITLPVLHNINDILL